MLVLTLVSFPLSAFATPGEAPVVTTFEPLISNGLLFKGQTTFEDVTSYGFEYGESTGYGETITLTEELSQYSLAFALGEAGSEPSQFSNTPNHLKVDPFGNIFIADGWNGILKFDSSGDFIKRIGQNGTSDGEFSYVHSFTFDDEGNIYVSDGAPSHRVQKLDNDGNFLMKFGSEGNGNGEFWALSDIGVNDNGDIYVLDSGNHRFQKFDANGNFVSKQGSYGSQEGQFYYLNKIEFDDNGNFYIADYNNNRIAKFNSQDQFDSYIAIPQVEGPNFKVNPNGEINFYSLEASSRKVKKLDSTGNVVAEFGKYGPDDDELSNPSNLYFDGDDVFIVDSYRVKKFVHSDTTSYFSARPQDLQCDSEYNFRAWAENAQGKSYGENKSFTTGECSNVTSSIVGTPSATKVTLEWEERLNGDYWKIAYRKTDTNDWAAIEIYNEGGNVVMGLDENSTYEFRVSSRSAYSDELWGLWSDPILITTLEAQDYPIDTCQELQDIGWDPETGETGDLEGNYYLTKDIDCSESESWHEEPIDFGFMGLHASGFIPIGDFNFEARDMYENAFYGNFDGRGHTISNIYQRGSSYMHGLFALTYGSEITNLTLENLNIELTRSVGYVGGLAGTSIDTTIENVHVNGNIASVAGEPPKYSPGNYLYDVVDTAAGLYVSTEYDGIVKLNEGGQVLANYGDLDNVGDFDVDTQGNIYTISSDRSSIVKYNSEGQEVIRFAQGDSYSIYRIDITDEDLVYVNGNDLSIYSATGELVQNIDVDASSTSSSQRIAVLDSGDFYIGDSGYLYKYNSAGELIEQIGSPGQNENDFYTITGLSVAPDGNLYVLDRDRQRISVVSPDGEFLNSFSLSPEVNDGRPEIYSISTFEVANDGSIYLLSARNLIHLDANGAYLDTLTEESIEMLSVGGLVGMGYSENVFASIVSRSSTDVDIDVTFSNLDMAFISGGVNYGTVDFSDFNSKGSIAVNGSGMETLVVSGITSYNLAGSIKRSYSSSDISATSDSLTGAGGLVSYGIGMTIEDSFYRGLIDLDSPTPIQAGIGAYLIESQIEDETNVRPVVLENNVYDESLAGTASCALAMDEQGDPIQIDDSACGSANEDGNEDAYFYGNRTSRPLDAWDFDNIWKVNNNELPTLRTTAVNPVEQEEDSEGVEEEIGAGGNSSLPPDGLPARKPVSLRGLNPSVGSTSSSGSNESDISGLENAESATKKLLEVLGDVDLNGGESAAIETFAQEGKSRSPLSPQLLVVSISGLAATAFIFGRWYLRWRKLPELVMEKPAPIKRWK